VSKRHELVSAIRAERKSAGGDVTGRHVRSRWSLSAFASIVTVGAVFVTLVPPVSPQQPAYALAQTGVQEAAQSLTLSHETGAVAARDTYEITQIVVAAPASPSAPAAGVPDPGSAQAIAHGMMSSYGWDDTEYSCLVALWNRESHWNVYAHNSSSGAYGIPQALPGEKMASAGADWATNPATQITWGLGYIAGRYGSPCGAWAHSEERGWY
jgi:hypothetical protein